MATGSINISSNISRSEMILQNYPPRPCKNLITKAKNGKVLLRWTDPDDSYITTDGISVEWGHTRIVRKTGSYPLNENDGTVVIESSIKNQYSVTEYEDTGLTNFTEYFYRAFSCSKNNVYNHEIVQSSATPVKYKIMTVKLDLNNSNPQKCATYADDAVGMAYGKTASKWDEFFGYRPCIFKNGKVVGYLNPSNFNKFEDGSDVDITSYAIGDVMIEFPRRGVKISKSDKIITISMTDAPVDENFTYYAHQRGIYDRDYFYLGAYLASYSFDSSTQTGFMSSLSGQEPINAMNDNSSFSNMCKFASAKGTNYGIMSYYQFLFIQCMYILQYKGTPGVGTVHGTGRYHEQYSYYLNRTGGTETKGLMYGVCTSSHNDMVPVKIFGLEDLWGNGDQYINNIALSSTAHIMTIKDDVTDVSNYKDVGYLGSNKSFDGYYTMCIGTSEAGFIADTSLNYNDEFKYSNGSSTTYFSAMTYLSRGCDAAYVQGMFSLFINRSRSNTSGNKCTTTRLQYL